MTISERYPPPITSLRDAQRYGFPFTFVVAIRCHVPKCSPTEICHSFFIRLNPSTLFAACYPIPPASSTSLTFPSYVSGMIYETLPVPWEDLFSVLHLDHIVVSFLFLSDLIAALSINKRFRIAALPQLKKLTLHAEQLFKASLSSLRSSKSLKIDSPPLTLDQIPNAFDVVGIGAFPRLEVFDISERLHIPSTVYIVFILCSYITGNRHSHCVSRCGDESLCYGDQERRVVVSQNAIHV